MYAHIQLHGKQTIYNLKVMKRMLQSKLKVGDLKFSN